MSQTVRSIRYAGMPYLDRTPYLGAGTDLQVDMVPFGDVQDLFRRQARGAEFESSELSLSTFIVMLSAGDTRFVGLPVFPSRSFRHRTLYVNERSGITSPRELRGARVGVPEYQMTAALWVRGMLADEYDVQPGDIDWYTGGLAEPGYRPRMNVDLPSDVRLTVIPEDKTLFSMLADGELDALCSVIPPDLENQPTVRPLFSDPAAAEREYFQRTGLFPIMHLVVLRRDLYETDPSLAAALADAFLAAKRIGQARLRRLDCLAVEIPWLGDALADVDTVFGGDAFPYGVAPNRGNLEKVLEYSYRQGLAQRKVDVEELFAPEAVAVLG
ncbi:MAG TPA: hypothetical protein VFJ19_18365 [Nocardioidaceae bacterium]|nr:hypothetical protein [Nocardioidaceae bacterium]